MRGSAQPFGIDLPLAVPGMKAEQPQHAQIIFRDARPRIAHEPHLARDKVFHPGGVIENLAAGRGIKRIDGEVAPRRILGPVVGEHHAGMAAIGLDIPAQRGDLEGMGAGNGGDGAVIHAGLDHLDVLGNQPGQHLAGRHGHGNVDVRNRRPQQRIAHRATDEARFAQRGHDLNGFRRGHPTVLGGINSHGRGLL